MADEEVEVVAAEPAAGLSEYSASSLFFVFIIAIIHSYYSSYHSFLYNQQNQINLPVLLTRRRGEEEEQEEQEEERSSQGEVWMRVAFLLLFCECFRSFSLSFLSLCSPSRP
jgi:hypothetical protein